MILVDTSAWVDFDRAAGTAADLRLAELISDGGSDVAVTEPVLGEVLAGARSGEDVERLRRLMHSFAWIRCDPVADFEGGAKIYRACRSSGVTPRGLVDCVVASIAIRSGAELLAADRDFDAMARVVPLRLSAA